MSISTKVRFGDCYTVSTTPQDFIGGFFNQLGIYNPKGSGKAIYISHIKVGFVLPTQITTNYLDFSLNKLTSDSTGTIFSGGLPVTPVNYKLNSSKESKAIVQESIALGSSYISTSATIGGSVYRSTLPATNVFAGNVDFLEFPILLNEGTGIMISRVTSILSSRQTFSLSFYEEDQTNPNP